MLSRFTRVAIVGAAVAVASIGLSTTALALPPGSPSAGAVTLSPATGNSDTAMTIVPEGAAPGCPGDSASDGYRWQSFIVSSSVDPATLTYNADGPIAPPGATAYPFYTVGAQSPVVNKNTAIKNAAGQGQIGPFEQVDLSVFSDSFPLPPGLYSFGYACTVQSGGSAVTMKFWSSQIQILADPVAGGTAGLRYAFVPVSPPVVPEVPFGVLLPASAIGLLGGATMVARRRRMKALV